MTDSPHRPATASPATAAAPVPVRQAIPRTRAFDSSLALLGEGYRFMPRRFEHFGRDIFATRLMLRQAVCMRGAEAARLFYASDRFTRRKALPPTALALLQGFPGAEMLDGAPHRHRKAMLLSLLQPQDNARLAALAAQSWRTRFAEWPARPGGRVVLLHEAQEVLAEAALRWAGITLVPASQRLRTEEFAAMVDAAGSVGPRNWRALWLRRRSERWARDLIEAVRSARLAPDPGSALAVIARHRDRDERLLDARTAAVELINLLRPTVAVARFVVFGALALHQHPQWRSRLAGGDDAQLAMFAQEVRRFYPFFPAVGGRATGAFEWNGLRFERGDWVLLDLYGTNHHPGIWRDPGRFDPERFADWRDDGHSLVAQGAGDYLAGHRCPGEMATLALVKSALQLLAAEAKYRVPPQDLDVNLARMPTMPNSAMVLEALR